MRINSKAQTILALLLICTVTVLAVVLASQQSLVIGGPP